MTELNAVPRKPGLFGRGPVFWAILFMVSSALFGLLAFTGAIEDKSAILILMAVPGGLLFAVIWSAHDKAKGNASRGKATAQAVYIKRVAICTSLYLGTFAAMISLGNELAVPQWARFVLALLPGLAISGNFWAIGRLIVEEQDEFLRMLIIRQSLIASALALTTASVWGFLESADMVVHVDAYWFAIIWFFGLGVGAIFNRIQYGTWGAV